ncbi:hypothetical protein D3H65_22600 [Paraflavitalea soli]|uniref:DUF3575 domain-containing protein n=1 Tax=Paraflavitalea soli TaxID=2315862 RepID=A0A3B7MR45_9BACT|nr:hypothetical protein [Paraflavitalea soli]AXY76618.1 hypothetical protein D3H65_22600 [Paraflavitalea soli]
MNLLQKILYSSTLLLTGLSLHAQSVEEQLVKPVIRCEDVRLNALQAIPHLYRQAPIDSVIRAISFWEGTCGLSEEIQRIKILVAIRNRHFSELLYDSSIIIMIDQFKQIKDLQPGDLFYGYRYRRDSVELSRVVGYNAFTKELARTLLPETDTASLENYFCRLYADTGNTAAVLDKPGFANTSLRNYYRRYGERVQRIPRGHLALTSGLWIPTGAATVLGNHPYIGLELGTRGQRDRFALLLYFKFVNSKQPYLIKRNDQLYETKDFFGGFIGLDYGRKMFGNETHLFELIGGGGLDGFDVYHTSDEDKRDQMKPMSILTYNFNGGVQYSLFYTKRKEAFLGIQARYNVTNYRNKGGTNLQGNPITIGLVWGAASARRYGPYRGYQY